MIGALLTPLLPLLRRYWLHAALLAALFGMWLYAGHESRRADAAEAKNAKVEAKAAQADANAKQWQSAFGTMRKSYDMVSNALHEQNAAIAQGHIQKAQYDATKDSAAKDATPTLGRLSEASTKIRAVQQTSATGCHTNDAATAYKGEF